MSDLSPYKTRAEEFFIHSLTELLSPMPRKPKSPRPKRKRSPEPDRPPEPLRSLETPHQAIIPTTPAPNKFQYLPKSPGRHSESPKLSTARFWRDKAEVLESPRKLRRDSRFNSQSISPGSTPSKQGLFKSRTAPTKSLPLSDDDIADILRKLKPHCPRAQAWVQAHEINKLEEARTKAQIEDRLELRRKIARRLRDKASVVAKESGAPKGEIKAFLEEQQVDADDANNPPEADILDEIQERVAIAHAQLQETMLDLDHWRKNR